MKTPSQPRAIYYIVAIQIWEYFSFYGMRALLILYLTLQLGFNDSHAIVLFTAYASLVFVTPILGCWLAYPLPANRPLVLAGALALSTGLTLPVLVSCPPFRLYFSLSFIFSSSSNSQTSYKNFRAHLGGGGILDRN